MADDKELETLVEKMIDEGKSQEEIAKAVDTYDAHPPDEWARRFNGLMKGLVADIPSNLYSMFLAAPVALAKDVVQSYEKGEISATNLKEMANSMSNAGNDFAKADPETQGRMVGDLIGSAGLAAGVALGAKPAARGVGAMMETTGTKSGFPFRIMAGHQILSGNPLGLGLAAVPEILKKGGTALQKWGGADLAKDLPSGTRTLDLGSVKGGIKLEPRVVEPPVKEGQVAVMGTPAEASGRVQKIIAKEEKAAVAAQAKQDKLDIENKKLDRLAEGMEGKEVRQGATRQTISAKTPGGVRLSRTDTFANPTKKVVPGAGASEIGTETSIEQAAKMLGDRRAELSPSALRQGQPTVAAQPSAAEATPAPTTGNAPVARKYDPTAVGQTSMPYTYRVHPNYVGPSEMLPDEGGPYTALPDLEVMSPDTAPPSAGVKMAPGKFDPATEAMFKKAPGSRSRTSPVSDIGLTPEDEAAFREAKGRGLDDEKAKQIMLFQRAQRSEMYNTGTTDPLAAEAMKQEMGL